MYQENKMQEGDAKYAEKTEKKTPTYTSVEFDVFMYKNFFN